MKAVKAKKQKEKPKSRMELMLGPPLQEVTKQKNPIEKKRSKKYQNVFSEVKNATTELKKAVGRR